jgi:hypothetical protein
LDASALAVSPRKATSEDRDPDRPRGGVIAVHDGSRLRKLVHTGVGRLRLSDVAGSWPVSAHELATSHHASWALKIEMGTLERVMDRFATQCRRGDDLTDQSLALFAIVQSEHHDGNLELWPHRLRGLPMPSAAMVRGTLDSICPAGYAMGLGLFEGGELWTCLAIRRSPTGVFNLILGPDEIRRDMGLLSGDWRRDYRHLIRAMEAKVGPLSLGCFSEASIFRRLEVDPTPGAWARAAAVRDVILSPVPAAMALPLGIDAGRAAFSALRGFAERVDPLGVVGPTLVALKKAALRQVGVEDEDDEPRFFGFDPLELLRRLLSREA